MSQPVFKRRPIVWNDNAGMCGTRGMRSTGDPTHLGPGPAIPDCPLCRDPKAVIHQYGLGFWCLEHKIVVLDE